MGVLPTRILPVNIVIVGAGVVGCAVAYELASRGAAVRVIDERGIGLGATRASAGMLAPYTEGHIPALRELGVHSLRLYDDFISRLRADSGQEVEYERSGSLHVAVDSRETTLLCGTAAELRDEGVAHTVLDPGQALAMEPQIRADVAGALHIHDHGYVSPAALTRALAAAAGRYGAVSSTARVLSVSGGDVARVVTATETIEADAVIVAAGSWSGFLTGDRDRHAVPGFPSTRDSSPGQLSAGVVKPIRGQLLQLRLKARPASRVVWGSGCYLVPRSDGTVLAGATVEDVGFDERATAAGVRHLLVESAQLMPVLQEAAFEEVRVGLRPMTADELPVIGPSSTMRHVFYAAGHYRNGVLLAPLTAALMADLLLDGRDSAALTLVRPDRLGL
jgi:glycine oxidase